MSHVRFNLRYGLKLMPKCDDNMLSHQAVPRLAAECVAHRVCWTPALPPKVTFVAAVAGKIATLAPTSHSRRCARYPRAVSAKLRAGI
jgi:hypothetical protein